MEDHESGNHTENGVGLRDIAVIAMRHRRLISLTFLSIFSGAILIAVLQPNRYEAALKILVKKDRVDPTSTPEADAGAPPTADVSEEELNSEVVLLKSRDLLERIVVACNLQQRNQRGALSILADMNPMRLFAGTRQKLTKVSSLRTGTARPVVDLSIVPPVPKTLVRVPDEKPGSGAAEALQRPALFQQGVPAVQSVELGTGNVQLDDSGSQPGVQGSGLDAEPASGGTSSYKYRTVADIIPAGSAQPDWPNMFATIGVHPSTRSAAENIGIAGAVRTLEKDLKVEVLKKTDLIAASYESSNPKLAAQVLTTLANLYIEKHVSVHRPAGAFDFFHREAERYREELSEAERRLVEFDREADVVSAPLEKEVTIQKLAELQITLNQTEAGIAETRRRIGVLQQAAASTPARMVTQMRNADDGMLITQLKTNLLTLEQKRIELLEKFEPSYRSVQEVDAQIATARAALADKSQVHEEVTDRDPTYEWTRGELAKANADLAGLQARAQAVASAVRTYEQNVRSLASKEVVQGDLVRNIKSAEEKYALSLRKEEEARISDALDRGRILNVAIADAATIPSLPSNHRLRTVFFGALLALFMSAALAFAAERADGTFRTPAEVGSVLNVPVLAAIPENGKNGAATYA
jgi:uncharacterized protein involved in exopolysaccharide biosynthesis